MPEGHTVHRHARQQRTELVGHALRTDVVQERFAASAARLDGQVMTDVEAWGKHLFQTWEGGEVVHVHLGLYGKWRRQASPPPPMRGAVRLRLVGPERSWDLAGATACELIGPDEQAAIVTRLGPDPLRRDADPERFLDRLTRSRAPVGTLLLDQSAVAGIGNLYRAEILFLQGVHPARAARELRDHEREGIWSETVDQLRLGLRRGKIITRRADEVVGPVSRLPRAEAHYVYHRDTCRICGGPLRRVELAARRIDLCPHCQPRRPHADHRPPVPS